MGCGASAHAVTFDAGAHDRIIILVAGPRSAGKSAFVRRFTDKAFDPDGAPKVSGERTITVNGEAVIVQLLNYSQIKPGTDLSNIDGIMYLVRGDVPTPFEGIYKYIDVLMNPTRLFHRVENLLGDAYDGVAATKCDPDPFRATVNGSAGSAVTASTGSSAKVTPTHINARVSLQDTKRPPPLSLGGAGGGAGPLAGVAPLDVSSPIGHGFRGLRLDTGKDPALGIDASIPPLAVAVSQCDTLDAMADTQPRALVRLRAMASNWASANRCRVTFVSSKTGVGVNSSLAYLIKQIYLRRRKNTIIAASASSPAAVAAN